MAASKIAELFVQIGQRGLEQTKAAVSGAVSFTQRAQSSVAGFASGAVRGLGDLGGLLRRMAEPALRLGALLGAATAPFVRGALSGTQEGEQLSKSLEMLGHVLADRLAPYVRALSAGIQALSEWFAGLSQETRDNVAAFVVATAAAGAALVAFGLLAAGVAALLTPVGGLVVAVAAVGAGLLWLAGAFDDNIDASERAARAVQFLSDAWIRVKGVAAAAGAFLGVVWENIVSASSAGAKNVVAFVGWLGENWNELLADIAVNTAATFRNLGLQFAMFGTKVALWVKSGFKEGFEDGLFGDPEAMREGLRKGLQRTTKDLPDLIQAQFKDPFQAAADVVVKMWDELAKNEGFGRRVVDQVRKLFRAAAGDEGLHLKLDVQFESLQGTFDRLQKALAAPADTVEKESLVKLGDIAGGVQKMLAEGIPIKGLLPAVGD